MAIGQWLPHPADCTLYNMNTSASFKVVSKRGSLPWPVRKHCACCRKTLHVVYLLWLELREVVSKPVSMGRQDELRISDVRLQTMDYSHHSEEHGLFVSYCFHLQFSVRCAGIWLLFETCLVSSGLQIQLHCSVLHLLLSPERNCA